MQTHFYYFLGNKKYPEIYILPQSALVSLSPKFCIMVQKNEGGGGVMDHFEKLKSHLFW